MCSNSEIPYIEVDADFPTCPHCGRQCSDVYESFDEENKNLEIEFRRTFYDSYFGVEIQEWNAVITCPKCNGRFQFDDASG